MAALSMLTLMRPKIDLYRALKMFSYKVQKRSPTRMLQN
jgi:hypothetical protein